MESLIWILPFLMFSTGLFLTARYMDKSYAALAFVPIINFYIIVSLAWHWIFLFSIICWMIVAWVFMFPVMFIFAFLIQIYLLFQLWMRTSGNLAQSIITWLLPPIWMLWIWISLYYKWKKESPKNKHNIKIVKCPSCNMRQQVRLDKPQHTCTECRKVLTLKKKT